MVSVANSLMSLMLGLFFTPGLPSDSLDLIPSDIYWQVKQVTVDEKQLGEILAPPAPAADVSALIEKLGDADPEVRRSSSETIRAMGPSVVQQLSSATKSDNPEIASKSEQLAKEIEAAGKSQDVRRLIAIRTAGELKLKALLPRLTELTQSSEPFVGQYASAAVAQIEGRTFLRPHADSLDDIRRLPGASVGFLHVRPDGGRSLSLAEFHEALKDIASPAQLAEFDRGVVELCQKLIAFTETAGNIRLDGISIALVPDMDRPPVMLLRGVFDRRGIVRAASSLSKTSRLGQADVIAFDENNRMVLVSDNLAAFIPGKAGPEGSLEAYVRVLQDAPPAASASPAVDEMLRKVDQKARLFGGVKVPDAWHNTDFFAHLKSLTFEGKEAEAKTQFRLVMQAADPESAVKVSEISRFGIGMVRTSMEPMLEGSNFPKALRPTLQKLTALVKGLEPAIDAADASTVRIEATSELTVQDLIAMVFGFSMSTSMEAPAAGPPPPAPLPPAPPPPAPN